MIPEADDGACVHEWGAPEEVELGLGTLWSPLCTHCGAVKLQVANQEYQRQQRALALRPINQPQQKAS